MKKILFISFALAMMLFNSCKEDFLDKEPPLYMEEKDIFSDAGRIDATALGLYAALKMDANRYALLGGKMLIALDNRGEDFINVSNNLITLYGTYRMNVGDSDSENTTYWRLAYRAINNANVFMDNLDNIEGAKAVAGTKYDQYIAEAKFVRAMAYYYLCMIYSEPYSINPNAKAVPLRLKAEKTNANNNLKRSTITEIYNSVLDDLKDETINALPTATKTYGAVSRANKGAALMLRMRVKMAMQNWDGAIADGKSVSGYTLTPSIKTAFSSPYYSAENIFSFPMETNNVPNTQYSYLEYYYASPTIMTLNMAAPGILSDTTYRQANDERVKTFAVKSGNYTLLAKYTTAQKLDWVPIFRYSETLLNLSECYMEKGGASESEAKDMLKLVRRRAVKEADDIMKDSDIDALTGNSLRTAVYKERRLEFIGEGIRGIDIVRRGQSFPAKGSGASAVAEVKPTDGNYIWSIPSSEKSVNKDIDK